MLSKNKRFEQKFIEFIQKNHLFDDTQTVLLAVSGGIDSMVMTYLFHKAAFRFAIAHCNFSLRGKEADKDEELVRHTCAVLKVPYYTIHFDTRTYAKQHKISIQMAARELRYQWFDELYAKKICHCVALAHHANDVAETLLINLIRGTGIRGLHGIKPRKDIFIRPLLFASKEEIANYALKCNILYREDQTNNEDKYIRNRVRHKIIPEMEQINPSLVAHLTNTSKSISETEEIYRYAVARLHKELVKKNDDGHTINITKLKKYFFNNSTLLYELLSPYSFNSSQINDIMASLNNVSGGTFISSTHVLLRDRDCLIIKPIKEHTKSQILIGKEDKFVKTGEINLQIDTVNRDALKLKDTPPHIIYINKDKLEYPLVLRSWEKGDKFKPLGMNGFKKLSDFFIDNKINLFKKKKIKLLLSGDKIVWVVGLRADDRFKITDRCKHILRIQILS